MARYIDGNYLLTYYKDFIVKDRPVRLEILKRYDQDVQSVVAAEIGDVQALNLDIQGGSEGVLAPIVKTSLRFTVVDSWDEPDVLDAGGNVIIKHGNWEEFYTPDSTLYLVRLRTALGASFYVTRWQGYITPDSWNESLDYRGSITITARDNIGHMKDFEFDMKGDQYGLVSIRNIINAGMAKVNLAMSLLYNEYNEDEGEDYGSPARGIVLQDGRSILDGLVCASLFEGRSYYDAVSDLLEAVGYTMRWADNDHVCVNPIRNMHLNVYVADDEQDSYPLTFFGGTRTLDPAYRSIEENVRYEKGDADVDIFEGLNFTGNRRSYQVYQQDTTGYDDEAAGSEKGWQAGYGFLDGSTLEPTDGLIEQQGVEAGTNGVLLVANDDSSFGRPVFILPVFSTQGTVKMEFGAPVSIREEGQGIYKLDVFDRGFKRMALYVRYIKNGVTRYWDGEGWDTAGSYSVNYDPTMRGPFTVEIPMNTCPLGSGGVLSIQFFEIEYAVGHGDEYGIYAKLTGLFYETNNDRLESDTVRTINDEAYNVRATRTPVVALMSKEVPVARPQDYQNVIYYDPGTGSRPAPYNVRFSGTTKELPLPAAIHTQILCYYHTPMSVLEGDCVCGEGVLPDGNWVFPEMDLLYRYKGRKYVLQSATLDCLTARLNGAIFREFLRYQELWGNELYTVTLVSAGAQKMAVIRAIADSAGMTVIQAKSIADNAPADIVVGVTMPEANTIKAAVEAAGGTVSISST